MSLTSVLSNPQVKKKLLKEFPNIPILKTKQKILAPSVSAHPQLVGVAFDYIVRFYIKRRKPSARERVWVAEASIEWGLLPKHYKRKGLKILTDAKNEYSKYIKSGKFHLSLLRSVFRLAQLDAIYRAGVIDSRLGFVDKKAIKDLRKLTSLLKPRFFKSTKRCELNPTFGSASEMVGGADADLIVGNTLIDIKVTKELKFTRKYFNQLIGYYVLSEIERSRDHFTSNCKIKNLGIYFARHGLLYSFPVASVFNRTKLGKVKKILHCYRYSE
jgi:hypothetical protein